MVSNLLNKVEARVELNENANLSRRSCDFVTFMYKVDQRSLNRHISGLLKATNNSADSTTFLDLVAEDSNGQSSCFSRSKFNLQERLQSLVCKNPNKYCFSEDLTPGSRVTTTDTEKEYISHNPLLTQNFKCNKEEIDFTINDCTRTISQFPTYEISEPHLSGDFYLNLVSWSSSNILAYGIGENVKLLSGGDPKKVSILNCANSSSSTNCLSSTNLLVSSSQSLRMSPPPQIVGSYNNNSYVTTNHSTSSFSSPFNLAKLNEPNKMWVTSIGWHAQGRYLAVGLLDGTIQLWDVEIPKIVQSYYTHEQRVGCISWGGFLLSSGSRDQSIITKDMRSGDIVSSYYQHSQEVCGLTWNPINQLLASGGNDNLVVVYDIRATKNSFLKLSAHTAAVKALAWNPHSPNILLTGAGTADRTLKFWNISTSALIRNVDTGSQVCNLSWAKSTNEIVSTHGYSLNQILVWKYPTMEKIAALTGHTHRVLYLTLSHSGETIVSGAGGEGLKFWNIFPPQFASPVSRKLRLSDFPPSIR